MYHHLSRDERIVICTMVDEGFSRTAIARRLNRHPGTITRELNRNRDQGRDYHYSRADRLAELRRQKPTVESKLSTCPELREKVEEKLLEKWSPEQVSDWLKSEGGEHQISHQTIYDYLFSLKREDRLRRYMRRRGRRNRRAKPGFINRQQQQRTSIHQRPKVVNQRKRIGDWEIDLMVCHRTSGYLITAVERKTGYVLIERVPNKQSHEVMRRIIKMFDRVPDSKTKTFTFDNGTEFYYHEMLTERLGVKTYFADPYNSGQRGTNENTNGLIRQYVPKTLDYEDFTWHHVRKVEHALNHRPRKRLKFQTPAARFH